LCYEYVVLKQICVIVEVESELKSSSEVDWKFNWGCYEGGAITQYEKAVSGKSYDFSDIKFEIWILNDPSNYLTPDQILKTQTLDVIENGKKTNFISLQKSKIITGYP